MTPQEFLAKIDSIRVNNPDRVYSWNGLVNGERVTLRGFNTQITRMSVGVLQHSIPYDLPADIWRDYLLQKVL